MKLISCDNIFFLCLHKISSDNSFVSWLIPEKEEAPSFFDEDNVKDLIKFIQDQDNPILINFAGRKEIFPFLRKNYSLGRYYPHRYNYLDLLEICREKYDDLKYKDDLFSFLLEYNLKESKMLLEDDYLNSEMSLTKKKEACLEEAGQIKRLWQKCFVCHEGWLWWGDLVTPATLSTICLRAVRSNELTEFDVSHGILYQIYESGHNWNIKDKINSCLAEIKCAACLSPVSNLRKKCEHRGEDVKRKAFHEFCLDNEAFDKFESLIKELKNRVSLDRNNSERRRKLKEIEGTHNLQDVINIWNIQDGKCHFCHTVLGKPTVKNSFEKDHLIPISRGGSDLPSNIALTCIKCNATKNAKTEEEYWKYLARKYGKEWVKSRKYKIRFIRREKRKLDAQKKRREKKRDDLKC